VESSSFRALNLRLLVWRRHKINTVFFKDELNSELKSLLEDKRVAVVGPAHYLTGKSQGSIIDDYDIVIRPNQFAVPPHLHEDYGSRTDVMFHNCGTPWMDGLKEQVAENPEDFRALKMVVCPVIKADHSENNFMSWPDDHISACAYNFKSISTVTPFYWIGVKNYRAAYKQIGCQPYTGIMTICTVLHYPIRELYVTGFDFYTGARVYHDGFLSSFDLDCESQNSGGSHGGNSNQAQMVFLKKLCNKIDILSIDHSLREILSKI